MKRGRNDRRNVQYRDDLASVTIIEGRDTAPSTSLQSSSTISTVSGSNAISYTTFDDQAVSREEVYHATERFLWRESWVAKIEARRSGVAITKVSDFSKRPTTSGTRMTFRSSQPNWLAIVGVSLIIALVALLWHGKTIDPRYQTFMPAEWHWDHNIYVPVTGVMTADKDDPPSLIVQVVPGSTLSQLGDISMQPNRAYARQWGIDFVRYDSGRSSYDRRACFEKIAVLNEVLDRQNNETSDGKYPWHHDQSIQYEYILLLPADAILMELDTDILAAILPPDKDKIVAIAGWGESDGLTSNSDILLFNLKHRHTEAVARLWLEMVTSVETTCGDNNDLGMLVTAIAMVAERNEELGALIQPLQETEDGFVGDRFIKTIPIAVPESRTAYLRDFLQQSAVSLQATSDAVCFRFFPKCEVLPAT